MTGPADLRAPTGPTHAPDPPPSPEVQARRLGWISVSRGLHLRGTRIPVREDDLEPLLLTLEGSSGTLAAALRAALLEQYRP